ncbi:MAG: hypothetical protein COU08_01635 [Candidatus Harrisonbacteria bacterium CG10_big_fil_rev_8_21_14_0_10_42_17]|uniref:Phosphatidic acid phosphatase type 2/haloperoxidase domain-containing protein n=1 Tax=Candidatus Harrisonbacteria bacterium CG10_big_fil_rev_8_21_14_0_10_42_17 TaxID=1974584 RepID=A0A2M6WIQ1_9BACT|nr:MAG: hypothetical protein COU08_01635 [Candidatus Harrisonbacteria bacterium CG10_big_fil_rev_8_21_14_0_10_42_17]
MFFDIALFASLFRFAHQNAFLDFFIVFLAEYLIYILLIAFVVYLFLESQWRVRFYRLALFAFSFILARGLFVTLLKYFIDRPRPFIVLNLDPLFWASHAAFPSGHTSVLFVMAGVAYFFHRRMSWLFVFLGLLIGIFRVVAGVHWPSDIVGGALVGIGSVYIAVRLLPRPTATLPPSSS